MKLLALTGLSFVLAGPAVAQDVDPSSDLGQFRALREAGMKAMDAHDNAAALDAFTKAGAVLPDSPSILLLKAQVLTAQNRREDAHAALVEYEKRGYVLDLKTNPDLSAVWDSDLDALQAANTAPVGAMHIAISLPGFALGQGIAYGSGSDALYLSTVRTGAVTVINASGTKPLLNFRPGVAAYAMSFHGGNLWAVTAASRQTKGYDAKANVKSRVVVINPDNGAIINSFTDPAKDRNFNSLLAGQNDLYVTDSNHGEVLRMNGYDGKFQTLVPEGYLDSPEALAESADGNTLIVSDFISGLYRVDLAKGSLNHLAAPGSGSLLGLSQLVRYGNDLIAVETGFKPERIVRLHMSPDWSRVENEEVILRGGDDLSQPAGGLVDGDHFVFIARSQWDNLDDRGNALKADPAPIVVGAIELKL